MRRVALIAAFREGLLLFGKRLDNGRYTLAGGHLEENESWEEGAARELKEEANLTPEGPFSLLNKQTHNDLEIRVYRCEVSGAPTGRNDPDKECAVWAFFDVSNGIPKSIAENMAGPKDPKHNLAAKEFGLEKKEEDLEKTSPGPRFPKMGFPDDRRETPIVSTPRELQNKAYLMGARSAGHMIADHLRSHPDRVATDADHRAVRNQLGAENTQGNGAAMSLGTNISFSKDNALRPLRGTVGDLVALHENAPMATREHENFHLMMGRVENKHNQKARIQLARNLYGAIQPAHRMALKAFMQTRHPSITVDHPLHREESLASLLNYMNNPGERSAFHQQMNFSPETARKFQTSMKGAHRDLLAAGNAADDSWSLGERPALVRMAFKAPQPTTPSPSPSPSPSLPAPTRSNALQVAAKANRPRPPKGDPNQLSMFKAEVKKRIFEKLKEAEEDLDKKISDISIGKPAPVPGNRPPGWREGAKFFDYNHALSPEHRDAGYSLHVSQRPEDTTAYLTHPSEPGKDIGRVRGETYSGDTIMPHSDLDKAHRGKGLGQAMYEAVYAHAFHNGIKKVKGYEHSYDAQRVHQKLAAKHGLVYKPQKPGFNEEGAPGEYSYVLKEEIPMDKDEDLLLEKAETDYEAQARVGLAPRGFVSPEGEFHPVGNEDHHDWVMNHTGVDEDSADNEYGKLMQAGWMAVGVAGSHNVQGARHHLENPSHPATLAVRRIAKNHWGQKFEGMIHGSTGSYEGADNYDTASFAHQGKLKPPSPFRKAELVKHDTPEFQSWFQGSKVATPDGKPLRVYHGTSKDVDFKSFKTGSRGTWFTTNPDTASDYAKDNDSQGAKYNHDTRNYDRTNLAPRVIPAYLALKNPYKMTDADHATANVDGYARQQGDFFNQLRTKGHDGVDMGNGTYVAFHPHQIKGIFNERPTEHKAINKDELSMQKAEEHDEVDRLLMHSSPSERRMALKLHSVQPKHLVRAFRDEDPGVQSSALSHPALNDDALHMLMQMPDREHLQLLALKDRKLSRDHLEALYHGHKDRPAPDKQDVMHAIGHHPALDSDLIEQMTNDGNGHQVVENLHTPPHCLQQLIEDHMLSPWDLDTKALARRAVKHPSAPIHLVEQAFKEGPMDMKMAVAQSQHLPEAIAHDIMTNGQLPGHDNEAMLRAAIVSNPAASPRHLETGAKDRNATVRQAASKRLGTFAKSLEASAWLDEQLRKATKPEDYENIVSNIDYDAKDTVDHKPDLTAHPPQHNYAAQAYKNAVLDSRAPFSKMSQPFGKDSDDDQGGVTPKIFYKLPATHPTHPGERFLIKPYHEKFAFGRRHSIHGWAEMTNQALYHAGGIGHLHQAVHVQEHAMSPNHPAEPALVVHMDPKMETMADAPGFKRAEVPESLRHDSRRVAMMDFLTGNVDRHEKNLMLNKRTPGNAKNGWKSKPPEKLLAIDSGLAFQYPSQHPLIKESLDKYNDNATHELSPFGGYEPSPEEYSKIKNDWTPAMDWWAQNRGNIKKSFNERLGMIKDPEMHHYLRRNFMARGKWLDRMADNGLENERDSWYSTQVPSYEKGTISDAERDAHNEENPNAEPFTRIEEPNKHLQPLWDEWMKKG